MHWLKYLRGSEVQHGVGALLAIATGAKYISSSTWIPHVEWLMFVAAMFGLGTANRYWNKKANGNGNGHNGNGNGNGQITGENKIV